MEILDLRSTSALHKHISAGATFVQQLVQQLVLRYWFSPATVSTFVAEICDKGGTAALVSTPSVYFSLPEASENPVMALRGFIFERKRPKPHGYLQISDIIGNIPWIYKIPH